MKFYFRCLQKKILVKLKKDLVLVNLEDHIRISYSKLSEFLFWS